MNPRSMIMETVDGKFEVWNDGELYSTHDRYNDALNDANYVYSMNRR